MRRILTAMATVGLLVGLAAGPVAAAPGGVDRYQVTNETMTVTLNYQGGTYIHVYDITMNPCDMTFAGTGSSGTWTETIVGSIDPAAGTIHWRATYTNYPGGYWWDITGTLTTGGFANGAGTDFLGRYFSGVTGTFVQTGSTDYRNHGDYVSFMGGGSDAAHSCIGMPIN